MAHPTEFREWVRFEKPWGFRRSFEVPRDLTPLEWAFIVKLARPHFNGCNHRRLPPGAFSEWPTTTVA